MEFLKIQFFSLCHPWFPSINLVQLLGQRKKSEELYNILNKFLDGGESDENLYDLYLHKRDVSFTLPQLLEWVTDAGQIKFLHAIRSFNIYKLQHLPNKNTYLSLHSTSDIFTQQSNRGTHVVEGKMEKRRKWRKEFLCNSRDFKHLPN